MDLLNVILDLLFRIVRILVDLQNKSDNKNSELDSVKGFEFKRDDDGDLYVFIDLSEYTGKVILVDPKIVDDFRDHNRYLRAYIKCYDPLTGKILYWWENQGYFDVLTSNMCTWFRTNDGKPIDIWKYQ